MAQDDAYRAAVSGERLKIRVRRHAVHHAFAMVEGLRQVVAGPPQSAIQGLVARPLQGLKSVTYPPRPSTSWLNRCEAAGVTGVLLAREVRSSRALPARTVASLVRGHGEHSDGSAGHPGQQPP